MSEATPNYPSLMPEACDGPSACAAEPGGPVQPILRATPAAGVEPAVLRPAVAEANVHCPPFRYELIPPLFERMHALGGWAVVALDGPGERVIVTDSTGMRLGYLFDSIQAMMPAEAGVKGGGNGEPMHPSRDHQTVRTPYFHDSDRGSLWWGDLLVKPLGPGADNQRLIFREWQRQGWPRHFTQPLPKSWRKPYRHKLGNMLRSLRRGMVHPVLRFSLDDAGEGIFWDHVLLPSRNGVQRDHVTP